MRRPLLVNGEQLRQTATAPSRGGGDKFKPYDIEENASRLAPQVDELEAGLASLPPALRGDRPVVEARLLPQFLSASAFPTKLFAAAGLVPVGTRTSRTDTVSPKGQPRPDELTKSVYLAVEDDLAGLRNILSNPFSRAVSKQVAEDLQALDVVRLPAAAIRLVEDSEAGGQPALYEAVLHGTVTRSGRLGPVSEEVVQRWADLVRQLQGVPEVEWTRRTGALTFMPVRLSADGARQAAAFNPLRAVQPMPRLRALPDVEFGVLPFTEPIGPNPVPPRALRVAVFDGGVDASSPYWHGRVTNTTVGSVVIDPRTQRHGALVTSALLYGHLASAPTLPNPADITVDHFEVMPQHGRTSELQMYWLLDVIDTQVRSSDYDVVTVCAAPSILIDDNLVDRWTATLDDLAHTQQVLFVVAAGNNGEDPAFGGLNRVLVPADAANVLAVGAADAQVPRARRAPYSAVGPGRPGARIRPSGIAFGGTATDPFIATDGDGTPLQFHGTSCAAPLVVHGLADLARRIGPTRTSPVVLRAFALHFTGPCRQGHTVNEVGYGHFRHEYSVVSDAAAHQAHVLYAGTIARGEFIPLSVPVPDGVSGNLLIRYTLVTSTSTNAGDSVDYTNAGLETTFRPHSNRFGFSRDGARTVYVDTRTQPELAASLLAQGYRASSDPATDSIGTNAKAEQVLRTEGKWETVRAGKHRYRNSAAKVHRPRIDITHLARENGVLVPSAPDLDWALLITLEADAGMDLYDQVRAQYSVLAPLPLPTATVPARSA